MLQRESFEELTIIMALLKKDLWTLGLNSLNFVKFMGNFCKVFAAYKRVRDSMAFLYQIAGNLLLLSTAINFVISQKFPFLPFLNLSIVTKWNMLNLCQ